MGVSYVVLWQDTFSHGHCALSSTASVLHRRHFNGDRAGVPVRTRCRRVYAVGVSTLTRFCNVHAGCWKLERKKGSWLCFTAPKAQPGSITRQNKIASEGCGPLRMLQKLLLITRPNEHFPPLASNAKQFSILVVFSSVGNFFGSHFSVRRQ